MTLETAQYLISALNYTLNKANVPTDVQETIKSNANQYILDRLKEPCNREDVIVEMTSYKVEEMFTTVTLLLNLDQSKIRLFVSSLDKPLQDYYDNVYYPKYMKGL